MSEKNTSSRLERALIISDGGVSTGVAAASHAERRIVDGQPVSGDAGVLWLVPGSDGTGAMPSRRRAVEHFAAAYGFGVVLGAGTLVGGATWPARMALEAVDAARAKRCGRVVWAIENPAAREPDDVSSDNVARVLDRCFLAERLAINELGSSPRIEAPHADLCDGQLADLALELAIPLESCWWWGETGHPERSRWLDALEAHGWSRSAVGQA